ncbi:hypothetical protein [Mucilaginibacter gilvus]|uniref:DUF695 domain-containing protein n=1 Tax=Mucilaginibacter gilvus TaxID=2305909 RepID=A0A444MMU1_9SPHI|nr:hypothetical protein [Mucilaginibacter gilvus]RWY50998.1 hypothetical protein EPL05_13075 [Mucilaginibacter gilvus]
MKSKENFWTWFVENSKFYARLNAIETAAKEDLLNQFQDRLHQYSDGLFFEIGGEPGEVNELIITATGDSEYFNDVETLIGDAPRIPDWTFTAFKQAVPGHFVTRWEFIELDTKDMYFNPLKKGTSTDLGVSVYLNNFDLSREDDFYNAIFTTLETILGERSFALDIDHVDIKKKTDNINTDDLIEILKLPNYIKWHKAKYNL